MTDVTATNFDDLFAADKVRADDVKDTGTDTDFEDVPHGVYEVALEKAELKASKSGKPMVSMWFKVVEGEHAGRLVFYNQVVSQAFQIQIVLKLMRAMETNVPLETVDISEDGLISYNMLAQRLGEVLRSSEYSGNEYQLNYTANVKNSDFSDFAIEKVFVKS